MYGKVEGTKEKMHVSIHIDASREKVWHTMLDLDSYKEWTTAFNPGSYYRGSWEEGSKILFLGPNPDGTSGEGGMVSRIRENREFEYISIEHLGIYKDGIEDTESEEAKKWAPAYENYKFIEKDGGTVVQVDMDILPEFREEFEKMWNLGLQKLKEIAER